MGSTPSKEVTETPSQRGKKKGVSRSPSSSPSTRTKNQTRGKSHTHTPREKSAKASVSRPASPKNDRSKKSTSKSPQKGTKSPRAEARDNTEKSRRDATSQEDSPKREDPSNGLRSGSAKSSSTSSLQPTKIKTFRINVPVSMEPNDIMSIKLDGVLTKILITTPTSGKTIKLSQQSLGEKEEKKDEFGTRCPPSQTSLTSSLIAPDIKYPDPNSNNGDDTIIASTKTEIPEGKMVVQARPVIVLHAVFTEKNKQLKEKMVNVAVRLIIQEAIDCECNALLGMSVSIKEEKSGEGYLVKATGTPCLLMPAQIILSTSASKSSASSASASNSVSSSLRQRQSSVDFACPPKIERVA